MKLNPFNTRIGLALGGGAAKGIAHIGVLKAFDPRFLGRSLLVELNGPRSRFSLVLFNTRKVLVLYVNKTPQDFLRTNSIA